MGEMNSILQVRNKLISVSKEEMLGTDSVWELRFGGFVLFFCLFVGFFLLILFLFVFPEGSLCNPVLELTL